MKSSQNLARIETTFDEDNLVPYAGLVPPAPLAQRLGLAGLIDRRVKLPADAVGRAGGGAKAMTVVGAMLAARCWHRPAAGVAGRSRPGPRSDHRRGLHDLLDLGAEKQGAKFDYTGARGYHPLLATLAATGEVLHARMRGGNAASARGPPCVEPSDPVYLFPFRTGSNGRKSNTSSEVRGEDDPYATLRILRASGPFRISRRA
jgi:hypothetical protein